jgi:hypothetical protein
MESQSLVDTTWHLGNQLPSILSPGDNAHGPKNMLLQKPKVLKTHLFNRRWA